MKDMTTTNVYRTIPSTPIHKMTIKDPGSSITHFIGLIMGVAMFALVGVLLVEMPDHLSIIQHIQMWYNYRYKQPKEYFYIPKERTHGTVKTNFDEDSKEWIEYQNMIQENRLSNDN